MPVGLFNVCQVEKLWKIFRVLIPSYVAGRVSAARAPTVAAVFNGLNHWNLKARSRWHSGTSTLSNESRVTGRTGSVLFRFRSGFALATASYQHFIARKHTHLPRSCDCRASLVGWRSSWAAVRWPVDRLALHQLPSENLILQPVNSRDDAGRLWRLLQQVPTSATVLTLSLG